jgi:hypothetical protein
VFQRRRNAQRGRVPERERLPCGLRRSAARPTPKPSTGPPWTPPGPQTPAPQAIATLEKGDDTGALIALSQLGSLLGGMPVLEADSSEVQLVAGELNSWAAVAVREKILLLMAQVRGPGAFGAGAPPCPPAAGRRLQAGRQRLRPRGGWEVALGGPQTLRPSCWHARLLRPRAHSTPPDLTPTPQIDEAHAELVARLMDLRPEEALPRVRAALDATGGIGV